MLDAVYSYQLPVVIIRGGSCPRAVTGGEMLSSENQNYLSEWEHVPPVTQVLPWLSVYSVLAGSSGVITGLLAVSVYRTTTESSSENNYYRDLVWPFLVILGVFTPSAFVYAVVAASGPPQIGYAGLTLFCLIVPWTVFAFRQSGRGFLLTRRRIGLLLLVEAPTTLSLGLILAPGLSNDLIPTAFNSFARFLSLIPLGVGFVAAGLLLLATYRHGSVTLGSGVTVVVLIMAIMFAAQVSRPDIPTVSATLISGSYLVFAVTAVVAVVRYDILSIRPGAGTLGERAVVNDMSEPVLVVGPQGTIGRSNQMAQALFGEDIDGKQFTDVLDCSVTELTDRETLERWTEQGRVRFDPRVSTLTRSDQTLGYAVTLIDVTDREMRKQRIQVLNRILRHNIRNDLDVIKARAQATTVDDKSTQKQVDIVLQVADGLEKLSADARRIQKLIQRSEDETARVALDTLIESVVDAVETDQTVVRIDVPALSLEVDEELLQFALRNLVENGIEHNDSDDPSVEIRGKMTDTGLTLTVADDGPGVPASEQSVIETGSERPLAHATSIGLWGTNWAVQKLGGELSFGESDLGGAAVTIEIPAGVIVSNHTEQQSYSEEGH
jgi:signal transduction histidine kinase